LILDLGCGTGLLLQKIRDMAKNVVGLDISKGMLEAVNLFVKRSANVHLVLADADHAPFRSGYFDTVFAITLLQNMPNPHNTLQEVKRITKPNASIIVTALKKRFTEGSFLKLLEKANLQPKLLKSDADLKCHIAACKKCN
jgi:ubiquinone/menaquinone biosynthesis C-methylase UbiE